MDVVYGELKQKQAWRSGSILFTSNSTAKLGDQSLKARQAGAG